MTPRHDTSALVGRDELGRSFTRARSRYANWLDYAGYAFVHLGCLGAFWTGVDGTDLLVCAASYVIGMMGLTLGYHRYFAHKAFRTSRAFQFVLALWGSLAVEKGPLWWASTHRLHHRYADTPRDIHSPVQQGFIFAHFGWFLDRRIRNTDMTLCPEFARYPELVWLTTWNLVPVTLYGLVLLALFGWSGLVWGFFVRTVLIWQVTHCIASLLHSFGGYRRFPTPDNSRNRLGLSLLLLGEGYHNNHHYAPYSARSGFAWWEVDVNWWVILLLRRLGLAWKVRLPKTAVIRGDCPTERGVRHRFGRWIGGLRLEVTSALDGAVDDPGDTVVVDRVRHALDSCIDRFAESAQAYLVERPERLKALFTALRDELAQAISDPVHGLTRPAVASARGAVSDALERHLATSQLRHLLA